MCRCNVKSNQLKTKNKKSLPNETRVPYIQIWSCRELRRVIESTKGWLWTASINVGAQLTNTIHNQGKGWKADWLIYPWVSEWLLEWCSDFEKFGHLLLASAVGKDKPHGHFSGLQVAAWNFYKETHLSEFGIDTQMWPIDRCNAVFGDKLLILVSILHFDTLESCSCGSTDQPCGWILLWALFQLLGQPLGRLDWSENCFIQLAIVNREDGHFKFQNRSELRCKSCKRSKIYA